MVILFVFFVWLKVGHVIDLSWWWLAFAVFAIVLDGFLTGLFEELAQVRRERRVWRYFR